MKNYFIKLIFVSLLLFVFTSVSYAQPCAGTSSFTVNLQPVGGGYAPGTVVTYCFTLNSWSMNGSNWFEGFNIQLGPGWLPGSITPVTPPTNFGGGGGQWVWVSNTFVNNGVTFGPGYFFDLNNNGITNDDFGDMGAGPWTMCFSVTVGFNVGASLGVGVATVSDGYAGSWSNGSCNGLNYNTLTPNSIIVLGCGSLIPGVVNQINVTCNGASTGSFEISTQNGNPPFTYSFQGGPFNNTNSFSGLPAGTYTVTIQDANNCTVPFPVTITQPPNPLSVTLIFKNNVGCFGGISGNYKVIGTGGTGPYQYSTDGVNFVPANNGAAFQTNGLTAGSYDVWVKDANGCTATLNIILTEPPAITGTIVSQTNPPCTGPGSGSVEVAGSGGTPNYTYSLNGGPIQLTGVFNNLTPGPYTITIKDANNCSTTVNINILSPSSTTTGSVVSQTNIDCFGASTGSLTLQGSNGNPPYTFSLNGGPFSAGPFNNLPAGLYNVVVQEANGCTGSFTATLTEPTALNLTIASQTNIDCFGASTGAVTLSANGGTAPYTYSFGATQNNTGAFNNLSAGNATFNVTDDHGCTASVSTNITQPATGVGANITTQNNVLCLGTNTGSFTIQGNSGNAPYSYTLNGVTNTTGTFTALGAGIYNVTVTDATGCTFVQAVNLTSPNALSVSIGNQTNVNCFGGNNGSVTINASSGTNPYTFTLGGTTNATGVFNNLVAGNYNVVVSDQNGCTLTQAVVITEPAAALSSSITTQQNVSCFGGSNGSVTVTAANGTAPYSYQLGGTNNTTGVFNNLSAGAYTVSITDNNGCLFNQNITITEPNAALGAITQNIVSVNCFGGNDGQIQVSGTGGTAPYSYSLGGVNNTTGTFSGLSAGNFNINLTDNNGCTFVYPIAITQPASALSATIANQTNVTCYNGSNGSVTINAAGGTPNYLYGISGTTFTNNNTIPGFSAGNYTVVVQDNNNCTASVNVNITQPLVPISATVNSTTDVLCFGNNTGAASVTAINGTAPYSYTLGATTNSTGNFSNLNAGNLTVNITDNNGCVGIVNLTINQPASALTAVIQNAGNPLCNGSTNGSATVLAGGGTAPYSYSWNTNPVQNNAQASNLGAGNYTVTVTDANLCMTTTNVTLTEPNFQLNTNPQYVVCSGEQVTLAATSLDGAAPVTYSWTNVANGSVLTGSPVNISPTSSVAFTVVATDANGCNTAAANVNVTVNPAPVASFTEDVKEGCQPLCVTFNTTSGGAGYSWQWDFGDTHTGVGQNPVNCFQNDGLFTVSLTVISPNGCSNTLQKNDLITVLRSPKAHFTTDPKETTLSNPTINFSNQSIGAESYLWQFGDRTTSTLFQPEHDYLEAREYCIRLIAKNDFGCTDSVKECVNIKPDFTIFVPNTFTPNSDGLNDVFMPIMQSVQEYEIKIYNRWGIVVFNSNNPSFGWDGAGQPQGAFNYFIQLKTYTGEEKIYTGSVTLYR
ncbi:MAG: gliding motility-associated C-terminal domain-containing protein [Bacteroidia bacterium]|nr:gliding motility-associated C-terminal domain-containing protein [Bacteroidia bacterium]MCZ2248535.1 gliding motility-associated C-terminal domain-containing protein [Bacteroidia bacterium]